MQQSFEGRYIQCRNPDKTGKEWVQATDCYGCRNKTFKSCANGWKKYFMITRSEKNFSQDPNKHLIKREWLWVSPDDLLCPDQEWNDPEEAKKRILEDDFRKEQYETIKREGIRIPLLGDTYINLREGSEFVEGKYYIFDGVHRMWISRFLNIDLVWIVCDTWDLNGSM